MKTKQLTNLIFLVFVEFDCPELILTITLTTAIRIMVLKISTKMAGAAKAQIEPSAGDNQQLLKDLEKNEFMKKN